MSDRTVNIVETTLRDGTYEVDFQLTTEDTAFFASHLERAGFEYIEVCHGVGFGAELWATPPKLVRAAASDIAHLEAAASVLTRAKLGVIMVVGPGFTPRSALATLKQLGVHFVRLAYLPDTIYDADCLAYIDEAKKQGLVVSINLMQTYALSPRRVAEAAVATAQRGADWFYFVDSAGGMTPTEIADYVRAICDATPMRVGLHAHNNTALAMAGCLAALDAGATLLDSTLQGIGRATGNPSTEQLLLALQRMGHETGIDRAAVFGLGELARPLFAERGNDATYFVSGAARLHSRYLAPLTREAQARKKAPREFIYQVGRVARARDLWNGEAFPVEVFEQAAQEMQSATPVRSSPQLLSALSAGLTRVSQPRLDAACADLFARAHKNRKRSVLCLVPADAFPFAGVLPWETGDLCGLAVGVTSSSLLAPPATDRAPGFILHDPSLAPPSSWLPTVPRITDSFGAALADATAALVTSLVGAGQVVLTQLHDPTFAAGLSARLADQAVTAVSQRGPGGAAVFLVESEGPWPALEKDDTVVVVRGGRSAAIDAARKSGFKVLRPPVQASLAGRATLRVQLHDRLRTAQSPAAGVVDPITAASSMEVVTDDPSAPNHVVDAAAIEPAASILAPLRAAALVAGRGKI